MVKQNLTQIEKELEKKYRRKEKRKKAKMKVSGAGVKRLQKLIKKRGIS